MARVCLATLDPDMQGGVPTMARLVYEIVEDAGHDPYLAFNRVNLTEDIRPWNVPFEGLSVEPVETTVDGMEARYVSRVLPEFEFLQYVLNADAWNEILADADVYFGVGGDNLCCHPLSRTDQEFACWVATSMWDDRSDRLETSSLALRIRDTLSKPVLEWLEKRIYMDAESILALSEYTSETLIKDVGVHQDKVDVVPYPVDTDMFSPVSQAEGDDSLSVLFVGRFSDPRKNTPILLRAFSKVKDEVPNATLHLIGDEPDSQIRSIVSRLDIENSVTFTEYVANEKLPEYYRAADVFVIPSHQEGLAIVGLEAMACGTPIVATRCGGPEEYVQDGENGYLVPTDDHSKLAERLSTILCQRELRQTMGERSREIVEQSYNREKISERIIDEINRLL